MTRNRVASIGLTALAILTPAVGGPLPAADDAVATSAAPVQVEPDLRSLRPAPGKPISDANAFKVLDRRR